MEEKDLVKKLYNYSEEEFLNGNNSKDIRRRNIENLLIEFISTKKPKWSADLDTKADDNN